MTPEAKARQQIGRKLEPAGRIIQDENQLNLSTGVGVAVRFTDNAGAKDPNDESARVLLSASVPSVKDTELPE